MSDIVLTRMAAYTERHGLLLVERLGSGIHGTVHVAERESKHDQSAIKAYNGAEFYHRERAVYERLQDAGITEVKGFHVPQLIRVDDELQVIEMTIVTPPFLLDFAAGYLDARPEFPEEAWAEWEAVKREQFGPRWREVRALLDELEALGIYLADVSPSNIAFPK